MMKQLLTRLFQCYRMRQVKAEWRERKLKQQLKKEQDKTQTGSQER